MIRILLADDESIFLEFMQTILNWGKYGCEICACVKDGRAALDAILSEKPDVAFIDISMLSWMEFEVCREVRKRKLPVKLVIVTGHDEFSFAYQAIKIGMIDICSSRLLVRNSQKRCKRPCRDLNRPKQQAARKSLRIWGRERQSMRLCLMQLKST